MAPTSYTLSRIEASIDRETLNGLLVQLESIVWGEPSVAHLVETPEPHRHVERDEVDVVVGRGFAGDHDRKSFYRGAYVPGREVSAMALEVLRVFEVDPVVVGDNLITSGIDLSALEAGSVLRIGDVVIERSWKEHRPCVHFRNRTSAEAFAAAARAGVRGALFVVREGGRIRCGQPIECV
jgi:hypothetical protein